MLYGVDVSNWQGGLKLAALRVDFAIVKATEGTNFVDRYCDGFVEQCKSAGMLWGFYHFAREGSATQECDHFIRNTKGYDKKGVPVLDWEGAQSVAWVNEFVRRYHDKTGVWCWIYANPWRFNQGGVEQNCMRWIASYPRVKSPSFETAKGWTCPSADGVVGAWQFCSDGRLSGWNGNLDCDLFYGDRRAWNAYTGATSSGSVGGDTNSSDGSVTLEGSGYRVTIEKSK